MGLVARLPDTHAQPSYRGRSFPFLQSLPHDDDDDDTDADAVVNDMDKDSTTSTLHNPGP